MTQFRVLGGDWGEGYKPGDIIDVDGTAMEIRLTKGEVEEIMKAEGNGTLASPEPKPAKTPAKRTKKA